MNKAERTIWSNVDRENTRYVCRCSRCGDYKETLKEHWFFTGMYCVDCIRYSLYDDTFVPYYEEERMR